MGVKRKKKKMWTVSEKMEIVQARQQGMLLEELSSLYGVNESAIIDWVKKYEAGGIGGLESAPRGGAAQKGAKVEAAAKMVEETTKNEPEAGISKVQGALYRHGLLSLARETVRQLLRRSGHGPQTQRMKRRNKPATPKFFERANPNELWQTDIMSFMIKGQYRAYLIGVGLFFDK